MTRPTYLFACAAAIVLVAAAYANSLGNSFHFDDGHVIETNLYLRSLDNLPRFFTDAGTFSSLPQNATYRPLVTLSLALDYARGALDPRPYHLTQIALLLITGALLVIFFIPITGRWPALFAATLFCVHTANSETLNLISARSELLSTIGLLGSFVLYQRFPVARRTLLYLIPLAIGALAKAPLVVFAPLLFFYALLIERQPAKRALRLALPPLILGIALLLFLNSMNSPHWTSGGGSAFHYLITQPFVWLHYARLFLFPIGLTADTDWQPFTQWYDTRAVAGYAFLAALIFAIRRAPAAVAFGLAWFAIALLPTSIFPLAEVANEHRIFFAYIGLVLAASTVLRTRTLAILGLALLIAHAIGTHERNKVWRTEATLWADVVAKSPANGRAWMNYGLTQMGEGSYAAAKTSFDRAAIYTPNYSTLEINQGIVDAAVGDHVSAERHFLRALALNPDHSAHFFYARWLLTRARGPEALTHLRTAVELSPAVPQQRALLLRLLLAIGADRELQTLATETRRLDPNDSTLREAARRWPTYEAAFTEGRTAIDRQDWLLAAQATRDALRHNPASADALNNLGWTLAQLGFRNEAIAAYEQALKLEPGHERARNNLAGLRRG